MTYKGIGEAFSETGTEGIIWCVLKDTSSEDEHFSYENLVPIENGDDLTIFDKIDRNKIVWHSTVAFETESHQETNDYGFTGQAIFNMWCHGLQKTEDQEQWAEYFLKNYPMTLRREDQGISLGGK
jgi:hypothetical protein